MAIEQVVAGLRCSDVLADLSDYLDGDLPSERRTRVEAHLRGCDACEQFGGVFANAIRALRKDASPTIVDESAVFERLRVRLGTTENRSTS